MDVSAIEAFNPNRINWRSMTAKQILKYKKQGVEVPNVYLQWANDFLKNVNKYDNDEVTYENAKASERHDSASKSSKVEGTQKNKQQEDEEENTSPTVSINTQQEGTPAAVENSSGEDSEEKETSLTPAQAKRQQLTDDNVSLRNQALSFTSDSIQTANDANTAENLLNTIKSDSDNEIQELENEMKSLIAQADAKQKELKEEVANINNNKSNNSTFAKIEQLQKELEQYGRTGQSASDQTENILNGYTQDIEGTTDIFTNASDFGAETINVGNDLIAEAGGPHTIFNLQDIIIGQNAVTEGNNSVDKGKSGESAQNDAKSANTDNLSKIPPLKNEIEQKTGVGALSKNNNETPEEKENPVTGEENNSEKDVKASQNDGTDTTDKLNISLDELVKRKVRRGDFSAES